MRTIHVTAGVVLRGDQILVARRAPHDSMPGTWEFPGGTVEEGESPAECVMREMMEETALDTELVRFLGLSTDQRPDLQLQLHFFELRYVSGEVQLVDHDAHEWATLQELPKFSFPPADAPLIDYWLEAGSVIPWSTPFGAA